MSHVREITRAEEPKLHIEVTKYSISPEEELFRGMQTGMVDDDGGIVSDDPRHNTDSSSLSFDADDPSNYYLARAVDEENERALDPEEKRHQFVERNSSKPLIFLQLKGADRRKGYIRVYLGNDK
ncbi:hypothetical protein AWC38_SpisGene24911, partial [Stylophora pistillata]